MKKAFTLAEVLITLGIIGVVAALTAPALTTNVGKAKVGPTLAKDVNVFENAFQQYFTDEEVSHLSGYAYDKAKMSYGRATIGETLAKYMVMSKTTSNKIKTQLGLAYTYTLGSCSGDAVMFQLKDGSIVCFEDTPDANTTFKTEKASAISEDPTTYRYPVQYLTIDINGAQKPNSPGKDQFRFLLYSSGEIVAYGSQRHKNLNDKITATCIAGNTGDAGWVCTGAIADNNWKASY